MTVLGKVTVVLSDDTRYTAGMTYDVVLSTPQTPDPSTLVQGSIETPEPTEGG